VARYDPANERWPVGVSRAPKTQATKTPQDIERLVLEIRQRLMADPWAQVGAVTIALTSSASPHLRPAPSKGSSPAPAPPSGAPAAAKCAQGQALSAGLSQDAREAVPPAQQHHGATVPEPRNHVGSCRRLVPLDHSLG